MRQSMRIIGFTITFGVLLFLMPKSSMAWFWETKCRDVSKRGYLNVLTINILFSEIQERDLRLNRIANYIKTCGEPIDIILLQEVVGGPLSGTVNSALDLKNKLAEGDNAIRYNLRHRLANGIPGLFTVGNAILSRCKISFTLSRTLPFVTEEPFNDIEIPLRRKVVMSRIRIPGFGKLHIYNTHLCAFCDPEERFEQTQVLVDFIEKVEKFIWGKNPIILGGDLNTNLDNPDDKPVYDMIIEKGFVDTYATVNNCCTDTTNENTCTTCCSQEDSYGGCTFAVPGNPYAVNPFTGEPGLPQRIDYILIKGKGIETWESTVIFNTNNTDATWVSDHSGVLTKLRLLPPRSP